MPETMSTPQSSSRFELLVQSVTDYAIYMLDADGIVASWNAGAERFKGYRQSEILGQHFSRFYTDEDKAAGLPARALKTAREEGRFEADGWRVRKDGSRFWANVVIDPIWENGGLVGYAKVTRDRTDRRLAEQALRRSEERFRLLVQSVTDYAIYMLDPSGVVISWNPGAQRAKGYVPEEIVGDHFSRFYTDEDRASGMPELALRAAREAGRFEAEGWRVRRDGTQFWANVVIDAVYDDDGELIGFAKITRDLTERRESQQALEQAREAFFQSQKMDAIGKLTGGVAHDFNNLLAAIIGSLDLAKRHAAKGNDATRFLDNAMKAAERGATLTQRMLAFARRQELKLETVDPVALVRGMASLLERTLGNGVSVETRFPLSIRAVSVDPAQLELAVLNLAVNGRDASPAGGRIIISANEDRMPVLRDGVAAPIDCVCISVIDHGEGMDAATLERAMEPFFTTKGVGRGTGLGLSMVHGFAEQCGGRLVLKSDPGVGTTAQLWLPVAVDQTVTDKLAEIAFVAPDVPPMTILAVDDDPLVLTNTAAMLEDLGHRVVRATSGAEALERLGEGAVDMIVTDYAMPDMTGAQLADAVRAVWPDKPVVLVSGFAELPDGAMPQVRKLAKPFLESELALAVADAAPGARAARKVVRLRPR
ncbi:PAS domain S-box protein [Sphingomonas sp. ID0503]|uniref:hybrid sensor histidine kinase/response regulator n=1 Tax=Sphingomonas sp. ID0503 TaxID=3399691 RepID=UPI003AFA7C06